MSTSGRVLIVDDYETNISALRQLLQRQGYEVLTATNGRDALDLVHREHPDLVLLDVVMPGMTGLDVCASLKNVAETCLTPIVLVSALQERATRLEGLEAGADDFLSKPVDPQELYARVRTLIRLKRLTDDLESAESLFLTLGRFIEARDPYTVNHCDRLAQYATALGSSLNLDPSDLDALYRGAFIHDIGKIAIPDRILLKKGKLTRTEYDLMKTHPIIGDDLCRTVRLLEAVRPIVRHHHERLDGSGYPDGLKGDDIPLLAQIMGIVDVYDAITTTRPYKPAATTEQAYKELLQEVNQGWRRKDLVDAFIAMHVSQAAEEILP
jgi:putative two-component system response regulator